MTIPYAEKIVSDYLRADAGVAAFAARIVGKTPSSTSLPWVRVTQIDAQNAGASTEFEQSLDYWIQFDCYAAADDQPNDGQPGANRLGMAVRAAIHEIQRADLTDAVVSRVRFTGHGRQPNSDVDEPAREGFRIEAMIRMRAK